MKEPNNQADKKFETKWKKFPFHLEKYYFWGWERK